MILGIMPCRGRPEQTVENIQALLKTAGSTPWHLALPVDDGDENTYLSIAESINSIEGDPATISPVSIRWLKPDLGRNWGYWRALEVATNTFRQCDLILNLANDLYPTEAGWLDRLYAAYRQRFGDGLGLMGLGGDGHGPGHSCHFLIHRGLLDQYGGWPVWYHHNYGDTELCHRAIEDGLYGKATRAVLEHRHPIRGTARDDEVYQLGRKHLAADEALFNLRRAQGWPDIRQTQEKAAS